MAYGGMDNGKINLQFVWKGRILSVFRDNYAVIRRHQSPIKLNNIRNDYFKFTSLTILENGARNLELIH
jgi:hypothetical protein